MKQDVNAPWRVCVEVGPGGKAPQPVSATVKNYLGKDVFGHPLPLELAEVLVDSVNDHERWKTDDIPTGLRPCPFCGGEAVFCAECTDPARDGITSRHSLFKTIVPEDHPSYSVQCLECVATLPGEFDTVEEARNAWNGRQAPVSVTVLCQDCQHCCFAGQHTCYCTRTGRSVAFDDFCSRGQRRIM